MTSQLRDVRVSASPDAQPARSAPAPGGGTLRVGILVSGMLQPAWITQLVRDIQAADFACVALVVVAEGAEPAPPAHPLAKAYLKLDLALARLERDPIRPEALRDALGEGVPGAVQIDTSGGVIGREDADSIGGRQLDVLLNFTEAALHEGAGPVARFGMWEHVAGAARAGAFDGLAEVAGRAFVVPSSLRAVEAGGSSRVICRSWSAAHEWSVARTRSAVLNKMSSLTLRKLREAAESGCVADAGPDEDPCSGRASGATGFIPRMLARAAGLAVRRARGRGSWFFGYTLDPAGDDPWRLDNLRTVIPPRDRLWADPFPIVVDGRAYIFFEELIHGGRGHISAIEVTADGPAGPAFRVLERPYHLSYPFLFRWNGSLYMLPESSANRTVELYRCVSFPGEWVLEKVLLEDIHAVDATLAEIDGRWWMFANVATGGMSDFDNLHLFYADTPLGPWTPHAQNPVQSDVRRARPAGAIQRRDGRLIRPGQDSSVRYGYAISLNEIVELTPERYHEVERGKILPEWRAGLQGTHCINHADGLTVIDGFWRPSFVRRAD
ncbi:MAG: hypothetical protein ICV87_02640 [Gemmatimonadetes bacterium]|nr:hypothetical protein [Gemmatimonadota bacterium]